MGPVVDQVLAIHPDGRRVAFPREGELHLWDRASMAYPRAIPEMNGLSDLAFAPGERLWAAANGGLVAWQLPGFTPAASWRDDLSPILTGLGGVRGAAPGRDLTVTGWRDGTFRVHRAKDAVPIATAFKVADSPLGRVALNTDESLAVAGSDAGDLLLFRLPGGERVETPAIGERPHADAVTGLAFLGRDVLVSASRDRTVRLWRASAAGLQPLFTLRQPRPVRSLALHADGAQLGLLLEGERAVRLWHLDRLVSSFNEREMGADVEELGQGVRATPAQPSQEPGVVTLERPRRGGRGLRAELFTDSWLLRCVKVCYNDQIAFDWKAAAPDPAVPANSYSIRWRGWLKAPCPGRYKLDLKVKGEALLVLDGTQRQIWTAVDEPKALMANLGREAHELLIEFRKTDRPAAVRLTWSREGGFGEQTVPTEALFWARDLADKATRPEPVLGK